MIIPWGGCNETVRKYKENAEKLILRGFLPENMEQESPVEI